MSDQPKISVRCPAGNANHHLWNKRGAWWCHFTFHLPHFTKRRLRRSLGTACLDLARQIRDFLLAALTAVAALLTIHSALSLVPTTRSPFQLKKP